MEAKVTIRKPGKEKEAMPEKVVQPVAPAAEEVKMPEMSANEKKEVENMFKNGKMPKIEADEIVKVAEEMGKMAGMMADMQGLKG